MPQVPEEAIQLRAAGFGRQEPNQYPYLPKPVGRLKFSLNPFSMCYQILGPSLCYRLACVLLIAVFIFIAWNMIPVILANSITG